jgi:hypothetical protein
MAPIYLAVFGIGKEDLKNEKFWGRLGRPRQCDAERVRRRRGMRMRRGVGRERRWAKGKAGKKG